MDAFGLKVVENPEEYLSDNPDVEQRLVDAAQSAFSQPGVPPEEETKEHVLDVSTLVLAYDFEQDEYIGFSAADEIEGTIYEGGIAVSEGKQENGLGQAMLARTIQDQMDDDSSIVTYRTQNPAMYDCSRKVFNAQPMEHGPTDPEVYEAISDVAEAMDPDEQFEHPVVKEAYSIPMYTELPERDSKDFLEELGMDYENGDAVIIGGKVDKQEIERKVDEYISQNPEIEEINQ